MFDLKIINGQVMRAAGPELLDIGVEDGKITEIGPHGSLGPAREELDAAGLVVMPGVVDIHFHCRAPSNPQRGDFHSETAAAVAGGVTTVFEMPISLPACSTPEVLANRRAVAEAQGIYANVALYSGAVLGSPEAAEAMAAAGAIGFKMFTISPPPDRQPEFGGLWTCEQSEMLGTLEALKPTGLRCVIHAENESLVKHFAALSTNGVTQRPPVVEALAISVIATIAASVGAPVHIAHVTSREALNAVRGARAEGAPITAETCPQYLTLNSGTVETYGSIAKIGPPLRPPGHAAVLWEALADGTLDVIASDHSPFRLEDKTGIEFARASMGLPTIELLVPVALDAAVRGVLTLTQAVNLLTASPARMFGLYPQKGAIEVGSDADLAIVSLADSFQPSPETLHSRAAELAVAFTSVTLHAKVETTVVDGAIVYAKSELRGEPIGRFVAGTAAATSIPER